MIEVELHIRNILCGLKKAFGERLVYLGLQGSYLRGEATEESDFDIMVVIKDLSASDLDLYKSVIGSLPHCEKACGFICGSEELRNWNALEITHLLHTTKDYYGELSELVPRCDERDIRSFIKLSVGNIYHELCHRYIYSDSDNNRKSLPFTYKGVFFILQNSYYLREKVFYKTKRELYSLLSCEDKAVFEIAQAIANNSDYDFDTAFNTLLCWCKKMLCEG
ncbi:MAG: nucleotidyltransferase domain-containing protein [Clostridia bacterium]|nr:nucleotidyltransferase domain-containing protein [Clostridia bacterium]